MPAQKSLETYWIHHVQHLGVDTGYVALKTYRKRWTIERSGERGSESSVLMTQHDDDDDEDDDDDDIRIYNFT